MDNTKDAFIWLKDNYSSLTENEYTELTDKWGKLKVYCPIVADEVSLYELNELSFVNGEWSFEVLSTESDESKLNDDYPIIPKSETTKDDNDWTKWASFMETQVTESGAVKDETVCEPNGAEVVELTEEEIAKLNGTTEESTDDGISEEVISTDETVVDSSEIVSDVAEDSTVDEVTESTDEVTESVEESSDDTTDEVVESVEETTDIVEETTADKVEENADVVEVGNVVEETTEQESSDVIEDISDTVTENVSDEVVDTTEQESTETTDENSTVETTDTVESTDDSTVTEEDNLEETTENVTN